MQNFTYYLDKFGEYGEVDQVNTPLLKVRGLPGVRLKELVLSETGDKGWVISLNRDNVEIFILTQNRIPAGTKFVRTELILSIPVGDYLFGKTISPIGLADLEESDTQNITLRSIDTAPKGIKSRARITRAFKTGTTIIDMMIPLGHGQKELVMGDRKTGKTMFVLTTIKKQIQEGIIPIYCLIGKKKSDIKKVEDQLAEEELKEKVIIVAASSSDSQSAIYLAPFSAMTIAEHFAEKGKDSLVILDDLYIHARFYRELSLISNNFPGRDSYPGDIFYTHARLLERAGNFIHPEKGQVSITCLPVVETVEGDMTGYIQTNLMGITDGHILFDNEIFNNGRRPAVNVQISVTRAGRQTQAQVNRDINRELTAFISLYEQMQNLSHFGTELTENVLMILRKGDLIFTFFDQHELEIVNEEVQLILFSLIWTDLINDQTKIQEARKKLQTAIVDGETKKIFQECINAKTFNEMLGKILAKKDYFLQLCP